MSADPHIRYRHPDTWFLSGSLQPSPGELCDRLSILALKLKHSIGTTRHQHFRREEVALVPHLPVLPTTLVDALARINETIWLRTGDVRELLATSGNMTDASDEAFAQLGRQYRVIFLLNEQRVAAIQAINAVVGETGEGAKL